MHLWFPLDDFSVGVLRTLNVASSQLLSNCWAYIQAFWLFCLAYYLEPTPQVFLQMYGIRLGDRVGWLSLVSQPRSCLLAPFISTYKNFKGGFLKVVIWKEGSQFFYVKLPRKIPTRRLLQTCMSSTRLLDLKGMFLINFLFSCSLTFIWLFFSFSYRVFHGYFWRKKLLQWLIQGVKAERRLIEVGNPQVQLAPFY